MESETPLHVLMVSFPGQGNINPSLRLAKCLASKGLFVTFSTTQNAGNRMQKSSTNESVGKGKIRFEFFSDGWEDDEPKRGDLASYFRQLETFGRDSFAKLVCKQSEKGCPVSCIINNSFLSWVVDLASIWMIPCALLWTQSCAVYSIYYHYCHQLCLFPTAEQPNIFVDIPGLPTLKPDEIVSFLHPFSPVRFLGEATSAQFRNISKCFCVLVDSFEELEHEAIAPIATVYPPIKPIGPLFKYPYGSEVDSVVRADLWSATDTVLEWLDTQSVGSVVYVAFGSIIGLGEEQMEEIAWGLLNSGMQFLWVIKPSALQVGSFTVPEGILNAVEGKGKIVQWCSQDKVLAHPSVCCFITHCGWNSTMESLSCGVPVIVFPQWGDQVTHAKLLVEVYSVGVSLGQEVRKLYSVSRKDVERGIVELLQGTNSKEMKNNAIKLKQAAEGAVAEGGSSQWNLQVFIDNIMNTVVESSHVEIRDM